VSAIVVGARWPRLARLRAGLPVLAAIIFIAIPPLYDAGYATSQQGQGQPLREMISRLEPYRDQLQGPQTRLLAARFGPDICNYIGGDRICVGRDLGPQLGNKPPHLAFGAWLDKLGINAIYADETVVSSLAFRQLLHNLEGREGWRRLAPSTGDQGWVLLYRSPQPSRVRI
jgi:hypothetical protein